MIGVDIHPKEILSTTKMGTKAKSLLLKFNSRSNKTKIFRNLKNAHPKSLYAGDFLTARRSKNLYNLRQLRGSPENGKFSICVRNGTHAYAIIKNENEWLKILTDDHLQNLRKKLDTLN